MRLPDTYGLPQWGHVRHRFDRAAGAFDGADAIHTEARARLLERLDLFALKPRAILDLGSGTGAALAALGARYPEAHIVAADLSHAMLRRRQAAGAAALLSAQCDAHALPLKRASLDLVFANLVLPWVVPERVFAECARVLKPGGLLLFTTVGPDTLVELRRAWSAVDDDVHVHGFIDMHDLGDLALRSGLAEPVMDVDRLEVSYPSLTALVTELRATGATNCALGRPAGLTSRARWRAFEAAFCTPADRARLSVTVELVFGQAWGCDRAEVVPTQNGTVARVAAAELARTARRRNAGD